MPGIVTLCSFCRAKLSVCVFSISNLKKTNSFCYKGQLNKGVYLRLILV